MISQTGTTAVRINSFVAARVARGVDLRWQSGWEDRIAGYNLYREQHGKLVRLNRTLIPSVFGGAATGHSYSWVDRNAPAAGALRYRLQMVSLSGKRSWVGGAVAAA